MCGVVRNGSTLHKQLLSSSSLVAVVVVVHNALWVKCKVVKFVTTIYGASLRLSRVCCAVVLCINTLVNVFPHHLLWTFSTPVERLDKGCCYCLFTMFKPLPLLRIKHFCSCWCGFFCSLYFLLQVLAWTRACVPTLICQVLKLWEKVARLLEPPPGVCVWSHDSTVKWLHLRLESV